MRSKPAPAAVVVKREHKEERIRTFLEAQLVSIGASPRTLKVICRSAESPAARALLSMGADLARSNVRIDAIFALIDAPDAAWLDADGAPFACETRHAANPRLLDAHEQIVIDDTTAWIGDSMRRDPDKRDAYECYAVEAAEVATFAGTSFDRIWQRSTPISSRTSSHTVDAALADTPFPPSTETASTALVATRH